MNERAATKKFRVATGKRVNSSDNAIYDLSNNKYFATLAIVQVAGATEDLAIEAGSTIHNSFLIHP